MSRELPLDDRAWCFPLWHKWAPWECFRRGVDYDFGTPFIYQERRCRRCGKLKIRSIG